MSEFELPGHQPAGTDRGTGSLRADLVRSHAAAVLAICMANTKRWHDAEDLMQETFIKAFAGLAGLRDTNKARSWLMQIARRLCIDHARRPKPTSAIPDDLLARPGTHDPRIERLHAALAELPGECREILNLYYLDGRDCTGVAAALGISPGAVRMRLLRARVMLYDILTGGDHG